jgi:uncharacterized BrkB/YihY/UPF0761 family membrane protein
MSAVYRGSLRWVVLLGVALGTVIPLLIAIWVFIGVAQEDGSPAGNILRVGCGVAMILVAVLVLGTWAIYSIPPGGRRGASGDGGD